MTVAKIIIKIIEYIGDNPKRLDLNYTPVRVAKSLRNIYYGYNTCLESISKSFDSSEFKLDLIYMRNIFFSSNCEHHMLPFFGHADLVYCPSTKILGFSKFIEILNFYSARLQTQERLAHQVADYIKHLLRPKAIMLKFTCKHTCMFMRNTKPVCVSSVVLVNEGMSIISSDLMYRMLNAIDAK